VLTSTDTGFNTPTAYANLRTVNFDAALLSGEGTRITTSRYEAPGGFLTSGGAVSYATGGPSLTGFSGNSAEIVSGSNGAASSLTVQFNNGGTSYVAMLLGISAKQENTQWVKFTYGSGTVETLYNCHSTTDANCLGKYVPSNWLTNLISGVWGIVFGSNSYNSVYLTYTPPSGETITKVEFFDDNCPACSGFLASSSQKMWIDNLSYVDSSLGPHHLEITTGSATVSAGSPVTFTVKACADAGCTAYTTGMSGTLNVSGAGVTTTYPGGSTYTIGARSSSTTLAASMTPSGTVTVSLASPSKSISSSPAVWCGFNAQPAAGNNCNLNVTTPLHHLEFTSSASSAVTCNPVTFTVRACADAGCGTFYTSGVTGTVSASGTDVSSYSSSFTIAPGSYSTGWSTNLAISSSAANTATATVSLSGYSPTPTHSVPVFYGMNDTAISGGSQDIVLSNSGLVFNVLNHEAEFAQTVAVRAIKTQDGTNACTPAFATVDKTVNFKCSYTNPSSGTRAVRVADATYNTYSALNASNSATAACDGTGADVVLKFDASGVATAKFLYGDVGSMALSALHTNGSLQMAGSDSFIALPYDFAVVTTTTGNIVAGANFNGTVTARNSAGGTTPNFGQESPTREGVSLSFVRTRPTFSGAVNGSFSGSVGLFSSGVATASNLRWTEVGRGDVVATLSSGSYLGINKQAAGSSAGSWIDCAAENSTCTLPTGATAIVAYGASGQRNFQAGVSGSIACSNGVFGDPISGTAKRCAYVVTSGANTGVSGAAGPFIPHHLTVSTPNACGSFTYSGQPVTTTIQAFNAIDAVNHIINYDGSNSTSSLNHAKAVTLSDVSGAGNGGWGGTNAVAASAFNSGVATVPTLAYTFTNKLTGETDLTVQAVDADGVSSSGYTQGALKVRSGRLKFSNAFGSERASLGVPVQAQYWSGKAWVTNSADSCTSVPAASVAMSKHLTGKGVAAIGTSAWATTASAVTISNGNGTLVLAAPAWTAGGSGSVVGSLELAFNLGSSSTDNACMGTHPTSTQAELSWLRSLNGNCSATYDRDPSARISFGVFSPESKKTVHVHDIY
jgi:hypothetical protein